MAILKNVSLGLRGVVLRNGDRLWIEPGDTIGMATAAIKLLPGGVEEEGKSPLDHDGDGKAGGSLKGEQSTAAKGRRRKSRA